MLYQLDIITLEDELMLAVVLLAGKDPEIDKQKHAASIKKIISYVAIHIFMDISVGYFSVQTLSIKYWIFNVYIH